MNLHQSLSGKIDEIVRLWIERVEKDQKINSDACLTYQAIRNKIPGLLKSLMARFSEMERGIERQEVFNDSVEHGSLRAEQGYDPVEIAREYRLLRDVLHELLADNLTELSADEVFEGMRIIDRTIDEAIAYCFDSYSTTKLERIQNLQNQLLLTNQELSRLVQDNHDRLSYLTHEIKNPLNSIIGYSSILIRLQEQKATSEHQEPSKNLQYLERVVKQGRQLLRLVNDATEIVRLHSGELKLVISDIDLIESLENIVELFQTTIQQKKLQFQWTCQVENTQLKTDGLRLEQILSNLIGNAVRYTPQGSIELLAEDIGDDRIRISISDTGIGIPEDELDCLFDPYYRVEHRKTEAHDDGTGLGLAVVKELVELLQGKIHVESSLDKGSTFSVVLPRKYQSV